MEKNYGKYLCKTVFLKISIFKSQIIKQSIFCSKNMQQHVKPIISWQKKCFVRKIIQRKWFSSFCKGSGSSLYQKRIVFMQLKSSDTLENCNIAFHIVSNIINSINPLKCSVHCSKDVLVRVADAMASVRWEKRDRYPGRFCSLFLSIPSKDL